MPIYEYFCPHCKSKFELIRSLSKSDEMASCPNCHNDAKKVFSSFFKNTNQLPTSIGNIGTGSSPCSTCSATSCATCKIK